MRPFWLAVGFGVMVAGPASGQDSAVARRVDSVPPSRITNAGVLRATAATDSVFIQRSLLVDTVDIGDFTAFLLANIGAPPFPDSLGFRVTADSQRIWLTGRLADFPAENRADLGPIFSFLDPRSPVTAEVSMPQSDSGILIFRLERLSVKGFVVPDLLLLAAMSKFKQEYPRMLAGDGREFHVATPVQAHARLVRNAIVLEMPRTP
ncbi:MAG TPA: hypothetical protein VGM77_00780 [Gemmatimonadales bacterium]|jgi:hypothetical protein